MVQSENLIMGEVRWKGQDDFDSDGVRILYSGGDECQRGVAVMLEGEVAKESDMRGTS